MNSRLLSVIGLWWFFFSSLYKLCRLVWHGDWCYCRWRTVLLDILVARTLRTRWTYSWGNLFYLLSGLLNMLRGCSLFFLRIYTRRWLGWSIWSISTIALFWQTWICIFMPSWRLKIVRNNFVEYWRKLRQKSAIWFQIHLDLNNKRLKWTWLQWLLV